MGDYSRDPAVRLVDSTEKHYVGVRLQQGVPLLDADWNELEDLRKYEVSEFVRRFIGDGVPDGNDGFRIQAIAGGGIGTLNLQAVSTITELTQLEVVLAGSSAADRLGFLPGDTTSQRSGSSPTILTGDASEPFILADGMTLTVRLNEGAEQIVTFNMTDFVDISAATLTEVTTVLNTNLINIASSAGTGNNFRIRGGEGTLETAGRMLVQGSEVQIEDDIMFTSQPLYQNDALATLWGVSVVLPISDVTTDRQDVVYLDVWEREVGYDEDEEMVQPVIGIETARRLRREWTVRVAEDTNSLSTISRQDGHKYTELAVIQRQLGEGNTINNTSINDTRRTQINIAKYLKTPVHVQQGATTLTANDLADVLETLNNILLRRYRERVFDFTYMDGYNEVVVRQAMESVVNYAKFSSAQVRSGNYNNADGVRVLAELADLQQEFVDVISEYGNDDGNTQTISFINDYSARLNDPTSGLQQATASGNLMSSVDAQQEINTWLSLPIGELPEGSVLVAIIDTQPETDILVGVPFNVTYQIESRVESSRELEDFTVVVDTASPSSWDFSPVTSVMTLTADGGIGTYILTVTPRSGTVSTEFNLTVSSVRNEAMVTLTHISPTYQVGLPPGQAEILQWIQPELSASGTLDLTQFMFSLGSGVVTFQIGVINTSEAGQTQRYQVSHYIIPPVGQEGSWVPNSGTPSIQEIDVANGATETIVLSITGPNPPDIGSQGTVFVEAVLILEGPSTPTESTVATLNIDFDIVS